MTRLTVSKAREEFPEVVNRAAHGKERTIVSSRGKDLAAVIPIEDLRLLERLAQEEMDRIDIEDARAALKEADEDKPLCRAPPVPWPGPGAFERKQRQQCRLLRCRISAKFSENQSWRVLFFS